jgi:hypothetical protein
MRIGTRFTETTLINQQREIHRAAEELYRVMALATPHDRDYYVQSDRAGKLARAAHVEKMRQVEAIAKEAMEIAVKIDEWNGR